MSASNRRVSIAFVCGAWALVSWLVTCVGGAQASSGLTLHWEAPAECPQSAWVQQRLRTLQGSTRPRRLAADGIMSHEGQLYRVRLVLRDESGTTERVLEAPSCADLAGAAVVHLALALRGEEPKSAGTAENAAASGVSPTNEGTHQDTPDTAQPNTTSTKSPSETAKAGEPVKAGAEQAHRAPASSVENHATGPAAAVSTRGWHLGLAAPLLVVNVGPLPEPALGLGTMATFMTRRVQFALGGEVDLKQTLVPGFAPAYAAVVARQALNASVCYGWRRSALEFAPCVSLWLEHLRVRGEGPDVTPETANVWWVSPSADTRVRWHVLAPLSLLGGLGLRLEGAHPRISIAGLGEVVRLGPASLTGFIATEWIF
jgi:hypothetical protein